MINTCWYYARCAHDFLATLVHNPDTPKGQSLGGRCFWVPFGLMQGMKVTLVREPLCEYRVVCVYGTKNVLFLMWSVQKHCEVYNAILPFMPC